MLALAKTAISDWIEDRAMSRGAAIAYYTVFSLAPLIMLVTAIASLVWDQAAVQQALYTELGALIGDKGVTLLQEVISGMAAKDTGIIATITGVVLLLIGSTTVFSELQDALNQIWRAAPLKVSGLWSWVRVRILSLSLIGAIGFLLLVSLTVSAIMAALGRAFANAWAGIALLVEAANLAISVTVIAALFGAVFKILPDVRIAWRDVVTGAIVTSVLFHVGKYLIALYIGLSDLNTAFGAAGALVTILIWVYYSAQIFLLGAEFTKAYAFAHGSRKHDEAERPHGAPPSPEAREKASETPPLR